MNFSETSLQDCFIIQPDVFKDSRGSFYESYNKGKLEDFLGYQVDFVQDNHSVSNRGVLRGLHYQNGDYAQAKLLRVIRGSVLDVVVDLRENSDTFGKTFKTQLSEFNNKALFIPRGMAHGFLALEDNTIFVYKCDNFYNKEAEGGIIYNDPTLNIEWEFPQDQIILSDKDRKLPNFAQRQL